MQRLLPLLAICFAFAAASLTAGAATESPQGWRVEPEVDPPSYAVAVPRSTTLNVDTVVLMCESAASGRALQLQLYLTEEGPLLPKSATADTIKEQPRAEVVVDGRSFVTEILFADTYVVLADARRDMSPALSPTLLDALTKGSQMTLRFDLLGDSAIDGDVVVDLAAGRSSISAVRRCATPPNDPPNVARVPD